MNSSTVDELVASFRLAYERRDGGEMSKLFKREGANHDGLEHLLVLLFRLRDKESDFTVESTGFPDPTFSFEDAAGHPITFNLEPTKLLKLTSASEHDDRTSRVIVRMPIGFDGEQFLLGLPVEQTLDSDDGYDAQ
jgi:hypothetical protein